MSLKIKKNNIHSLKALGDTPGGKVLVDFLIGNIVDSVNQLIAGGDKEKLIAVMKVNLELSQQIIKAEENEKEIDELIAQALRE